MEKDHIYYRHIRPGMPDELIDLTAIFGPGKEPRTEKELEKALKESFPEYYIYVEENSKKAMSFSFYEEETDAKTI